MFWKKKNRCQRFFTYEKKELNISGLSASLPKEAGSLTFSLGQLNIKPEFEKVSDKLQNLDLLQFTLCQEIANLDEGPKKQEIIVNIIDIKLEMMLMAQHPERYEDDLKKK